MGERLQVERRETICSFNWLGLAPLSLCTLMAANTGSGVVIPSIFNMDLSPSYGWVSSTVYAVLLAVVLYLYRVNQLLKGTPAEIRKLSGSRWTATQLRATYHRLERSPVDYTDRLPPRLERRYVVTGGSG